MLPRIETLSSRWLVGKSLEMSLENNRTGQLWGSFMPFRNKISHRISEDVLSLQVYPADYFAHFSIATRFAKWAAVEVSHVDFLPEGMESFELAGGPYAVFDYKGSSNDHRIFDYIFGTWLPGSIYLLDERPHFERLGPNYKNNDPNSEEEIWIPIRGKR